MASPVDTSVKNFNSTMSGAPALSGTAGSLIALLDALLVNGFDTKTASSLTVAGGVASMPFVGSHSAQVDSVVSISGITGTYASLNGEQKITAIGAGVVKFATAMADGVAAGTIIFKMAPAGWEKVFTGPSKAGYRSLDPASTKMLLRVDDSAATAARVTGYESMSDVDTGAGPFPTAAQVSGGGYWVKSSAANATAVPWSLHADGRLFYFSNTPLIPSNSTWLGGATRCFGDGIPYRPGGDNYLVFLSVNPTLDFSNPILGALGSAGGASARWIAVPRSESGLGSALLTTKGPFTGAMGDTSGVTGTLGVFPSTVDGSLILAKVYSALDVSNPPRGEFPGFYHAPQYNVWNTFKMNDVAPGSGPLAGRKLQAVSTTSSMNSVSPIGTGAAFIDITGPWR